MTEVGHYEEDVSRETLKSEFQHFLKLVEEDNGTGFVFPSVDKKLLKLYPVVDTVAWIEKLLRLGVKTVQLRIKEPGQPDLEDQLIKAIQLGQKYKAQVFINDYWQLAIKHGAYGVHLGQEDLEVADLKQIHSANLRLGISTHGYKEILRAVRIRPSYIALGHIFPTTTKVMPSKPQGLTRLKLYQQLIDGVNKFWKTDIPTVAIGGIDLNNATDVMRCGVDSLAVVRAITLAQDIAMAVANFSTLINDADEEHKHDISIFCEEKMSTLSISINNKPVEIDERIRTVEQLASQKNIIMQGCAIAVNGIIIPGSKWSETRLNKGDQISLFQAIAGG